MMLGYVLKNGQFVQTFYPPASGPAVEYKAIQGRRGVWLVPADYQPSGVKLYPDLDTLKVALALRRGE